MACTAARAAADKCCARTLHFPPAGHALEVDPGRRVGGSVASGTRGEPGLPAAAAAAKGLVSAAGSEREAADPAAVIPSAAASAIPSAAASWLRRSLKAFSRTRAGK
jgi:hypothetical protein